MLWWEEVVSCKLMVQRVSQKVTYVSRSGNERYSDGEEALIDSRDVFENFDDDRGISTCNFRFSKI